PDLINNIWVNPGEDLNGNGLVYDLADLDGIDNDGNGYVDDLFGYDFSGGNVGNSETDVVEESDWNPDIHAGDDGWGEPDPSVGDGESSMMLMPADAGVYHGTHCAGIVAATIDNGYAFAGAAGNCKILPVRIGYADGGMYGSDIIEGVVYAVAAGAHTLFLPHGLGHMMGMDVHDMEDLGENNVGYTQTFTRASQFGLKSLRMGKELKPGHVITVEPGCYFIPALIEKWKKEGTNKQFINFDKLEPFYNFGGIRLEDDVLVTDNKCRLLGAKRLPITVADVEREMSGN
ncbi:MAG: M24 family metallopeptidase, partial [Bacteroidia bacterium]|nr:M24 family metallopeptidase [Bacteroidia bacterium]